ncbi:MAG: hypothetical protein E7260_02640 [Lachnospiraceae bacterium]|nr:hypothetical protein [Lachnospiraceae bacterium]
MNYKEEYRFAKAREKEEKRVQRENRRLQRRLAWEERYEAFWAKVERLSPPGQDVNSLRIIYPISLALSQVALFFDFINRWTEAESIIEVYRIGETLCTTGVLPGYLYLITHAFRWPGYLVLLFLCFVIGNYTCYYQESKSIYTMKRIPDRFEIHKRAWAVPFLFVLGLLAVSVVTALLCMFIYLTCSRQICIPQEWFNWDSGVLGTRRW